MRRSPFVHRFELGSGSALFHSLTLQVVFGPPGAFRSSRTPAGQEDAFPDPDEEGRILSLLRSRAAENTWAMGCIFLHYECHSSCRYCFLREREPGAMTEDEVAGAVRDFSRLARGSGRSSADLLLFGGEPFLRPDLIDAALESLPENPSINLSISTCGEGVEEGIASRLGSAGAFAIVSLDGLSRSHESARPSAGRSSFSLSLEAFHVLRRAGCRTGISMTISRWNLEDFMDSFRWVLEDLQPDDIGLNGWLHPPFGKRRAPGQTGWADILRMSTECLDMALGKGVYVEQMFRRLRPFATSSPRLKDCTSAGGRLVYVPGGLRGRCDCMSAAGLGLESVSRDVVPGPGIVPSDFSPINAVACTTCPAVCLCGGGCRYDALCSTGSATGTVESRCRFERGMLRWMLERLHRECGSPGARGEYVVPTCRDRLALLGKPPEAWRVSVPMPDSTSYAERPT